MTLLQKLTQYLDTPEAKKFTPKQNAAFWYGAICALAVCGETETALQLCALLRVKIPEVD